MEAGEPETEDRTTPLELFFDLVFVFAITQVTALLAADPTWRGLVRALLVQAALWWAWSAYAWLTNTIDHAAGVNRLAMLVAMAAMLVAALATLGVFDDNGVLFGCAYLIVRVMHIVLYARRSPDTAIRRGILRLAPTGIAPAAVIVVAALLETPVREVVWGVALAVDYAGPYVFGVRGLRVSAGHFAERFGLIVIIALGESIVAIGIGTAGQTLDAGLVTAAALAMLVSMTLWWAYFDTLATLAERALRAERGDAQSALARDAYSYLHMPMITGIVLLAAGIKQTLAYADQPLSSVSATALCGGVAVYLVAQGAVKLRTHHTVSVGRLTAVAGCVVLAPVATRVDAIVSLAAVAVVSTSYIVYEAVGYRETRAQIRAAG